ncbi:serine/threonine-protein kinase [Streptomyces sp. NRRL B-24484]|uniref:serine/threonine-protein kinase n=1 Tax=Streptomyces sp. NRRL B-24484 TaxID=1463833 RepID=UPI000694ECD8|nr:protein kinase [Streptomyces sp. NRRL B-24484]
MEHLREDDPELIGPYRLFALLGRGGWGNVYFARTEYGRAVALKTVRPDRLAEAPERFRTRFAREVQAARAVGSEYTAEVVDADTRAPEPWFAARYIPGIDLADALERHGAPLPQRTWRVLATGLADALRSIHASGLVHRDLKLANVLLAGTGPAVIDFGIARHLAPTHGGTLTATGVALRTTTFASPEQLRDERVGPASDMFALGLVLAYTALARHPFGPGSAAQIGANILHGTPQLDGMPPALERIVRPCLEPRPQNRPDPAEFARLLPADGQQRGREWLPPALRVAVDERSAIALDLAEPMRSGPPWSGRSGPVTPTAPPAPTADGPPAAGARALRERSLAPAPSRGPGEESTTLPPTGQAAAAKAPVPARAVKRPGTPGAKFLADAEAGDTEAMRRLAASLKQAGDLEGALGWFRRSAAGRNPTGAREAALLIEQHLPHHRPKVMALYRQAAEAGDLHATMRLGELLEQEPGGLPDALKWFERAAAHNHAKAADAVLRVRAAATRTVLSPGEQAVLRQHRDAALDGDGNAMLALGTWYHKEKRLQDALVWYRRAAEADHAHGMLLTAQLLGKDPQRQGESAHWYGLAAAAGNTEALHVLGRRLREEGRTAEALDHLRRAGERDHLPSMVEAAALLEESGQRVRAVEWYERAAAKGHSGAARQAERLRAATAPAAGSPAGKATGKSAPKTTPPKAAAAQPTAGKKAAAAPKTDAAPGAAPKAAAPPAADVRAAAHAEAAEHERNGRLEDAVHCYTQAEALGDKEAKREIARLCLKLCDRTDDVEERRRLRRRAVKRYRDLADGGDPRALRMMTELDTTNGAKWQRRSALAGSTKAMREVARSHLEADGPGDLRTALDWLRRAGQAGNTAAIVDGARACEARGDVREAIDWYRWAAESGNEQAAREADRLETSHLGTALWRRLSGRLRRTLG